MKNSIFISIWLLLASCSYKKANDKKNFYYYLISSNRENNGDTIKYNEGKDIGKDDELLALDHFMYNKKDHFISMYTSDNHAPIDGGTLYYTLDSIGTIFSKSTTWWASSRLQSNNDSINSIINAALAHILLKSELHCYHCRQAENTEYKFVPPVIKLE